MRPAEDTPEPRPSRELLTFLGGWLVPLGVTVSLEFGPNAGVWATSVALGFIIWGLWRHERRADHSER